MSGAVAEQMEERPRLGDRVKLCGNHPLAGEIGVYLADRPYYERGEVYPVVKIGTITETFVLDPENQMKKA